MKAIEFCAWCIMLHLWCSTHRQQAAETLRLMLAEAKENDRRKRLSAALARYGSTR